MTRARRPEDWQRDLAAARAAEARMAEQLASDRRIEKLVDHTHDFDRLDFSFEYAGMRVAVDLKEKRQAYSVLYRSMWPDLRPEDLFILDETVYRRAGGRSSVPGS